MRKRKHLLVGMVVLAGVASAGAGDVGVGPAEGEPVQGGVDLSGPA